jgi:CRISPR-associated protein Csm3
MYSKLAIKGIIDILTGMHIGGSSAFSAIGAVDSPVVKDTLTGLPLLPGSSLKGKMRTLLARSENSELIKDPNQDVEPILRLFGSSKKDNIKAGRLLFSDAVMSNWSELEKRGLRSSTEVKFENTISRLTAVANPRQIERAVRGSHFPLELIYEVNSQSDEEIIKDMELIAKGFKLLQYDYIGGSGSRGYGKIAFKNLVVSLGIGNTSDSLISKCNDIFKIFN